MALAQKTKKLPEISPAQTRILQRLLRGESNAEIAAKLKLSTFTVANHMRNLFDAYKVESRSKLLARFVVIPEDLQLKAGRPRA
jgi:DNA-binding CsgD family transcriptional regulator